eukprot:CAMPEP_0114546076 /NCGR_PEP_ID=MMETSP0114-20121206/3746_1 /TAXON_ID=31324 /ORGANISM="Goniomonas sp, Strain m" /LENGTH=1134 /DNA_ID=CAMNT_0001730557 /DNA_START=28 /DNA_END=3432 /DNA_ORIENTATION=-
MSGWGFSWYSSAAPPPNLEPRPRVFEFGITLQLEVSGDWFVIEISDPTFQLGISPDTRFRLGDRLLTVDCHNVQCKSASELCELIKGPLETPVTLEVAGQDELLPRTVLVMRSPDGAVGDPDGSRKPSDCTEESLDIVSVQLDGADNATRTMGEVLGELELLPGEECRIFVSQCKCSYCGDQSLDGQLVITNYRLAFLALPEQVGLSNKGHSYGQRRYASHSLGEGLVKGVTGLFTQPIAGAVENGVSGFFSGVRRGLMGAAIRPASGMAAAFSGSVIGKPPGVPFDRYYHQETIISLPLLSIEVAVRPPDAPRRLLLHCKDTRGAVLEFTSSAEMFKESESWTQGMSGIEVCESVFRMLDSAICPQTCVEAFAFQMPFPLPDGWDIFNAQEEYQRMGVDDAGGAWRFCYCNLNYKLAPSYPARLVVPATVEDELVTAAAEFRSKSRLPVMCWKRKGSDVGICRSAQPLSGVLRKRSAFDEKLITALACTGERRPLMIVDPRPLRNAMANEAMGAGYEEKEHYAETDVVFMDIENIHEVHRSYDRLRTLSDRAVEDDDDFMLHLHSTRWLYHIGRLLRAASIIVEQVLSGTTVLVHCSDGWDRTSQCTALAQLCLDPYYRTQRGFAVLIEKEWLSFGHKFSDRCGLACPASHDKYTMQQEFSPVFIQFIECVWQLTMQFPTVFEFNEDFLLQLLDHAASGRFGTFLFNCEAERVEAQVAQRTNSVWPVLFRSSLRNPDYCYVDQTLHPVWQQRGLALWSGYFLRYNALVCTAAELSQRNVTCVPLPDLFPSTPSPSRSPVNSPRLDESFAMVPPSRQKGNGLDSVILVSTPESWTPPPACSAPAPSPTWTPVPASDSPPPFPQLTPSKPNGVANGTTPNGVAGRVAGGAIVHGSSDAGAIVVGSSDRPPRPAVDQIKPQGVDERADDLRAAAIVRSSGDTLPPRRAGGTIAIVNHPNAVGGVASERASAGSGAGGGSAEVSATRGEDRSASGDLEGRDTPSVAARVAVAAPSEAKAGAGTVPVNTPPSSERSSAVVATENNSASGPAPVAPDTAAATTTSTAAVTSEPSVEARPTHGRKHECRDPTIGGNVNGGPDHGIVRDRSGDSVVRGDCCDTVVIDTDTGLAVRGGKVQG